MDKKDKTLLIGPWVGEFGWELFTWQGLARQISKDYGKTIVMSKRGHDFLYGDFADEFIPIDLPDGVFSDSWFCRDGMMKIVPTEFVKGMITDVNYNDRLNPDTNCRGMFTMRGDGVANTNQLFHMQDFIKYESDTIDKQFDLILHPRNKGVGDDRNWDINKWQLLVNQLRDKYTIAIIGTNEAFKLEGAADLRNISIKDTVSILNRAKLIAGQSSGPLHLASLAGTPQLVWSTEYNRNRYIKYWNPFKTPVHFFSEMGWNPSVDFIYQKIVEVLK